MVQRRNHKESQKRLKMSEHRNTKCQNIWDTVEAILRRNLNAYIEKQEKSQINSLTLQDKEVENKEQTKPKFIRRKEIIIRAETN